VGEKEKGGGKMHFLIFLHCGTEKKERDKKCQTSEKEEKEQDKA